MKVKCKCGEFILDEHIEYLNGVNELGEDFSKCKAVCQCGNEYRWSDWVWQDSMVECKISLAEEFNLETFNRLRRK